jgi:phosphomannomutase
MNDVRFDLDQVLSLVDQAHSDQKLTAGAVANIRAWLTESRYREYSPLVVEHIQRGDWKTLDDVFWTIIPFGTGGRRGRMYPIGSNAINDRTIGESAQGLADYVIATLPGKNLSCAIAYDTRHRSRHFAELCASIMVANGFKVYFIDDYRSTPELSFLVRYRHCSCGIMVTASHNPPSDNAVKVYWSTGGQLVPPHDDGVIARVETVDEIRRVDFAQAVKSGQVELCKAEIDAALLKEHLQQSFPGPRDLKILYSPLHGVGEFNVSAALAGVGFKQVEMYEPHRKPDGDFPNVPDHVSNPENVKVFDAMIEHARKSGAEVCLATDPDCDRMGCAAPLTNDLSGAWKALNGNQLCALLAEYVLSQRKALNKLTEKSFVVTTLVTTPLVKRIAQAFGAKCFDNNLVGFKWIADVVDREGPDHFIYGCEESHGYVVGQYARDKDGAVACMLLCELASLAKSQGQTLHQKMDALYRQHGLHAERVLNVFMHGSDGMKRMQNLMTVLRQNPPKELGGSPILQMRDYQTQTIRLADGTTKRLDGPRSNLLIFDFDQDGNQVAVRPSGTEPKIKFYEFGFLAANQFNASNMHHSMKALDAKLAGWGVELQKIADAS